MHGSEPPIRVYVGADRSQMLGFRVLARSIRKRTGRETQISPLIDLDLPAPPDPRFRARTGFSFARFAIPALAGYAGRAIYLDADMLVFSDISELWSLPMDGAKVLCQESLPDHIAASAPRAGGRRKKQCSVMLLDCAALNWDVREIIAGLGPSYTYEELMDHLCILEDAEVGYSVPITWNSLEHWDEDTRLIHYTDMMTQPWVFAANPNGWRWVDEVREMLADGELSRADIENEIKAGFVRPSLLTELSLPSGPIGEPMMAALQADDARSGFRAHKSLRSAGFRSTAANLGRAAAARLALLLNTGQRP